MFTPRESSIPWWFLRSFASTYILRIPLTMGRRSAPRRRLRYDRGILSLCASRRVTTRGRPPVMSLVLVFSRDFASTSPACTSSPSLTSVAREGISTSLRTFPAITDKNRGLMLFHRQGGGGSVTDVLREAELRLPALSSSNRRRSSESSRILAVR